MKYELSGNIMTDFSGWRPKTTAIKQIKVIKT